MGEGVGCVLAFFSEPGDHYLGRILAGLDPSSYSFGCLPPHFNRIDPLEDPDIKRAMDMMFGPLKIAYEGKDYNPTPMLLRGLACVIHHSTSLVQVMVDHPAHEFTTLTLLNDYELMEGLKAFVTTEKAEGVSSTATGIPPHISMAVYVRDVMDKT